MKTMCRILDVSESGYYAWRKREPGQRQRENERPTEQIAQAFRQGRGVYGSPRVRAELQGQGISCGKHRVARLMRQAGLQAIWKQRRVCTTDSHHNDPVAPNLLQRDFTAPAPTEMADRHYRHMDRLLAGCTWPWSWMSIHGSSWDGPWQAIGRRAWWKRLCGWRLVDANLLRS